MAEKDSIVSVCDIPHTFFIHSSFVHQQTLRLFPRTRLWSRKTKAVFPAQSLMTLGAIVNVLTLLFLMGSKEILIHLIPIQKLLFGIEHSAWNVVSAYYLLTQVCLLVIQRTLQPPGNLGKTEIISKDFKSSPHEHKAQILKLSKLADFFN